ncbi:hypothetical protein FOZ61_005545 [Perkinsus olseni]|uniref:Aminotransferase class I/classII large domain-containing protein n=1 Tax=Perkinsus olseni TaxID=32597 RepID=A0A7J6LGV0_PEROL|nr:hypothetical protein FOZ61_005545 [Perkinsus olseni]
MSSSQQALTVESMNQNIRKAEYAVRGAVVAKAAEMRKRIADGDKTVPFDRTIPCNIGNPQVVGQKPITYYRQVAAICTYPALMESSEFPEDVKAAAKYYLDGSNGVGTGGYTMSPGLPCIRKQVAAYIERRDGYPCDTEKLFLTTGASEGIKRVIDMVIAKPGVDGVLLPCPQYPLYSCALTMNGGRYDYYYLKEENGWSVSQEELQTSYDRAIGEGINLKAIAVINPGNPCGSVLSQEDIHGIITFARDHGLLIMADEVYQENIYTERKFFSFKRILRDLQKENPGKFDQVQLVSFHSTSKGLLGECGQRGGYMELVGFDEPTLAQFNKVAASCLSSNTLGQIFVGLMCTPPPEDGPSYPLFKQERQSIYDGLKRRAEGITKEFNKIEGMSCQRVQGAMYAFVKIDLPEKATEAAKARGLASADVMYCLDLVEQTGIVCVPGNGFKEVEGTNHFRITILPPDDMMKEMIGKLAEFQKNFLAKYH